MEADVDHRRRTPEYVVEKLNGKEAQGIGDRLGGGGGEGRAREEEMR